MNTPWHKLPFGKFVLYEINRPMFRPFVIAGVATFFIAGVLPTMKLSKEDKEASKYYQKVNGTFDYAAHH